MSNVFKLFSRVRLKDSAEGSIVTVYTEPSEGYDIETADADGTDLYGDGGWRTVNAEDIAEVLWEPKEKYS